MGLGQAPEIHELDPAERMSVDELRALQLDRLRWTLRHAYANVPFYRKKFDAAGVSPEDCRSLEDLAGLPGHDQGRPAGELPDRHVRGPRDRAAADPRLERDHRPAHGGGLHPAGPGYLVGPDGPVDPGGGRAARRHGARGLRLRPVHRRAGRPLRRRAAGLHGHSGFGRHDRTAGEADRRPAAAGDHGHADLHADHPRRV